MPHLVATLIYLSQINSYYIRGDMSPLNSGESSYTFYTANVSIIPQSPSVNKKQAHLSLKYYNFPVS